MNVERHTASLKYSQVKELLRKAVADGEYVPGGILPGERFLAAKVGVSYMTARRAMEALVMEGLFERQGKRTVVHRDAFSLASSTKLNVIYYMVLNAFTEPLMNEVERKARELGWITQWTAMRSPDDPLAVAAIDSGNLTLVLLPTDTFLKGAIGAALLRSNGRAVLLGNQMNSDLVTWVQAADRRVMHTAVHHLSDLGHRDILFVHGDDMHHGLQEALAEFREAELTHGLHLRRRTPLCVKTNHFEARPHAAQHAASEYFAHHRVRPTAVICHNDELAVGVLQALRRIGMNVPQDISLLSFGNTVLTEYAFPPITVIDLDFTRHVEVAVAALNKALTDHSERRQYLITPQLLVRESTAVAPAAKSASPD